MLVSIAEHVGRFTYASRQSPTTGNRRHTLDRQGSGVTAAQYDQAADNQKAADRLASSMRRFIAGQGFDAYAEAATTYTHYAPQYPTDAWKAIDSIVREPGRGISGHWHAAVTIACLTVGGTVAEVSAVAGWALILIPMAGWIALSMRVAAPRKIANNRRHQMSLHLDDKVTELWVDEVFARRALLETRRQEERATKGRPNIPAPRPQPFGVSHQGAEALCAEWMQHLGEERAKVTRVSGDGGIDVESPAYIGQVKNYGSNTAVGAPEVRELAGVASVDGRTPLFFTSGRYTAEAEAFAEGAGIALFIYSAERGTLVGANSLGAVLRESGLD